MNAPTFDVDVMPDPLTDESARESDQRAWVRAVEAEGRALARDRAMALRVAALFAGVESVAQGFARLGVDVACGLSVGLVVYAPNVEAWDEAADWVMDARHDALRLARDLNRKRVDLFASSLLWSDELAALRRATATDDDRAARVDRKRKGARLRALLSVAHDRDRWFRRVWLSVRGTAGESGAELWRAARLADDAAAAFNDAAGVGGAS